MTVPGNTAVLVTLLAVFVACTGYATGRLHQWYRTGLDRDEAYRDGYDTATRSTFSLAARIVGPRRDKGVRASASVPAPASTSEPSRPGRHFVPDELVHAPTYRLTPGRVGRAKVRPAEPPAGPSDDDATPRTPVPKPRSS